MKPVKFELLRSTLLLCMLPVESVVALNLAANDLNEENDGLLIDGLPYQIASEKTESEQIAESFRDQLRSLETDNVMTTDKADPVEPFTLLSPEENLLLDDELLKLQQKKLHHAIGAMQLRYRSGESGMSELFESKVPIDINMNTGSGRLGVNFTTVMLSSGRLLNDAELQSRYGSLALIDEEQRSNSVSSDSQAGLGINISYETSGFHVNVGTTPLGFEVSQQILGIGYKHNFNSGFNIGVDLSRSPVTDSLLSYAGIQDKNTGQTWGGVMKNAGEIKAGFHSQDFGLYLNNTVAVYQGENVETNDFFQFVTGLYFFPYKNQHVKFKTGLNLTYFSFEKNQRYFTLGHGGYFSPNFFYGVDIPFQVLYTKGRMQINAEMALGIQSFREDEAPYYPSDSLLQSALDGVDDQVSIYQEDSQNKLASQGGIDVIYNLMQTLSVHGGINFNRSASYNESHFTVGVEYRFGSSY